MLYLPFNDPGAWFKNGVGFVIAETTVEFRAAAA